MQGAAESRKCFPAASCGFGLPPGGLLLLFEQFTLSPYTEKLSTCSGKRASRHRSKSFLCTAQVRNIFTFSKKIFY